MAANLRQWEADPLFPAAEVVQDSADRMESIFRLLLHEQSVVQGDQSDAKLCSSIEYHKRDLMTALGTTKWQLEDFERAVNLSAFSDNSRVTEYAISRHKQFIRAIREQIVHMEKCLDDPSMGVSEGKTRWINLNDQDRDGLALFLSGGNPVDHHTLYESESSSIMRRFLDSNVSSGYDDKSDEIIELKTEEIENSNMNRVLELDRNIDSLVENKLRKVGSHYSSRLGFEPSVSHQDTYGDKHGEDGSWDLEACDANAKSFFSKSKLRGCNSRLNGLGFLGNLWSKYGGRMARSSTKRQKDGELGFEFDHRPSSPYIGTSQADQGLNVLSSLVSGYRIYGQIFSKILSNSLQSCGWIGACGGRFQRSLYFIQVNRLPLQLTTAIFITLVVLVLKRGSLLLSQK